MILLIIGDNMNKLGTYILNTLVFILLLLAYISNGRIIEIGNNLTINLTFFIFPLIFLMLCVISKFYNYSEAKKTIKSACISLLIFIGIIMLLNLIPSNTDTQEMEILFKTLFTPNKFSLLGLKIYYPNLIYLISYTILSFVTSYIMIAIYNAIKDETKDFIAFFLSLFISLILFTIVLISIEALLINQLPFKEYIYMLTAGFIVVIVLSIIMLLINSIVNAFKKSNQN